MKNNGQVIANDRSRNKIEKLKENLKRLGIKNVVPIVGDAKALLTNYENSADRVLIDPPCTALGVRPKLYENKTEKDIINNSNYQKYFLHIAKKLTKPEGIIVYSTCTLSPEENEMNIQYMVEKLKLKLVEQSIYIGSSGEMLKNLNSGLLQRFYPDIHKTSGFFIAKFEVPR